MIWIEQLAKHDLTWFIFYIYPNIMCLEEMLVSEERWVIWSRNLVHKQRWMVTSHLIMLKQEQLELLQNVKYLIFFDIPTLVIYYLVGIICHMLLTRLKFTYVAGKIEVSDILCSVLNSLLCIYYKSWMLIFIF